MKFGRNKQLNPSVHYELQLGTYGYAIKEMFGRLDGMYLYYYNKDTSDMRAVSVPLTYVSRAYIFWNVVGGPTNSAISCIAYCSGASVYYIWVTGRIASQNLPRIPRQADVSNTEYLRVSGKVSHWEVNRRVTL